MLKTIESKNYSKNRSNNGLNRGLPLASDSPASSNCSNESKSNSFTANKNAVRKKQLLSHFLPYDPTEKTQKRLKDGLNEYLLLLEISEQAMQALQHRQLFSFDPLVGENACQIRAVKIALIVRHSTMNIEEILRRIRQAKEKVEEFLKCCSDFSAIGLSLWQFLESEQIDIELGEDECFLIESFILTKTKVVRPFFKHDMPLVENAYTDIKKIKELGKVGRDFSNELIKKIRMQLSAKSVGFIQQLADKIDLEDIDSRIFSDEFLYFHNGLSCLPMYWTFRILMHHALESRIPIVMLAQQFAKDEDYRWIKNIQLFFQPTSQGYQQACSSTMVLETPVIVLVGSTCKDLNQLPDLDDWAKELTMYYPIDLVLAYAAVHRQYPDESKDQMFLEFADKNYEFHKKKAKEWGCSLENPSRFFLTHVYCDTIKNVSDRFH